MTPRPLLIGGKRGPLASLPVSAVASSSTQPLASSFQNLGTATLSAPMAQRYCDVALPVPLRSTFTYAVPAALAREDLIGHRVVVRFRNRPVVGVALAE